MNYFPYMSFKYAAAIILIAIILGVSSCTICPLAIYQYIHIVQLSSSPPIVTWYHSFHSSPATSSEPAGHPLSCAVARRLLSGRRCSSPLPAIASARCGSGRPVAHRGTRCRCGCRPVLQHQQLLIWRFMLRLLPSAAVAAPCGRGCTSSSAAGWLPLVSTCMWWSAAAPHRHHFRSAAGAEPRTPSIRPPDCGCCDFSTCGCYCTRISSVLLAGDISALFSAHGDICSQFLRYP